MVPGLLNLSNTCFLNSLLQGLAACPSFVRWLEKFSDSPMIQSCKDNHLSNTLLQLLKGTWTQSVRWIFREEWFIHISDLCAPTALSCDGPGEEDLLDAGRLLDVLRLYRWHISSFEEQVCHLAVEWDLVYISVQKHIMQCFINIFSGCVALFPQGCTWTFSCPHIFSGGGTGSSTQSHSLVRHAVTRGKLSSVSLNGTKISFSCHVPPICFIVQYFEVHVWSWGG